MLKWNRLVAVFFETLVFVVLTGASGISEAESLRVGVFNLNNPALNGMSNQERDNTFKRWSMEMFSKADVVVLSELGTPSWTLWDPAYLTRMAELSGLKYSFAGFTKDPTWVDAALISRFPLLDRHAEALPGPGGRNIVEATISVGGMAHRIIGTHFTQIGPGPHQAEPDRIKSARRIVERARGIANVIFGGDLNTCPPDPEGCRNNIHSDGAEHRILTDDGFKDAYYEVRGSSFCSDKRIDYLFVRGVYRITGYETCSFNDAAKPSDHPFILVTLEFDAAPPPSPPGCDGICCGDLRSDGVCVGQCAIPPQRCY